MSIITVQLGQCGNQLGEQIFQNLHEELNHQDIISSPPEVRGLEAYFHLPRRSLSDIERYIQDKRSGKKVNALEGSVPQMSIARAVLVDMEPKVVQGCLAGKGISNDDFSWKYDAVSTHFKQGGSANNWAFGFKRHGPESEEKIMEAVRRQVELCDGLEGLQVLQSVAGGTGSMKQFANDDIESHTTSLIIKCPICLTYVSYMSHQK